METRSKCPQEVKGTESMEQVWEGVGQVTLSWPLGATPAQRLQMNK